MLRNWSWALCGGVLAALAPLAVAQETAVDEARPAPQLADRYLASEVIGMNVVNAEDETIAGIDDLVMDRTGKVQYLIAGRGGVAGVGETHLAIPLQRLEFVRTDDGTWRANLAMTRAQLDRAPELESDVYRELSDINWVKTNAQFFGAGTDAVNAGPVEHPEVFRASKILGTRIVGQAAEDAEMGRVEDLVLNRDWRADYAILGVGGVANVGATFIAAPFEALQFRYNTDDDVVTVAVKATRQQLETAPIVEKADSYGRLADPAFAEQVKRHFQTTDTTPAVP